MAYKTAAELFGDGGVWGTQVPIDLGPPSGVYDPTNRGIGFGEQLTSAIANRSHYALALNDDDLNARLVVFETDGLDAAYRGGALATPGSGRVIVKDGGAVETTSALGSQYADDVANAHFRADAFGDTTSGGGFDFRGRAVASPAYGVMSRMNLDPSVTYTTMLDSEAVTLNPGGVGGAVVRFPSSVHNGTNTDVALQGLDFLEITGTASDDGLYRVYGLGPTNADLLVRKLDNSVPAFLAGAAATSKFFVANAVTSGMTNVSSGLAVSATGNEDAVLAIFGRDTDGLLGTGPTPALAFYPQREDGGSPGALAYFTSTGRLKSAVTADGLSTKARDIEWVEGGLPIINVNKSEGGLSGYHEVGLLVRDENGSTSSYAGLETRGRIIESATYGVNASINGTFAAPMGRVILPDSDGTPLPPAGQLHGFWATLVQPGATLVKILTGTGAGRYYRLGSVTLDAVFTNPDEMALTHLDGSALDPGELPTAGALTFAFYSSTTVGGRTAPVAVDSGPAGWTAPADITPNTLLERSTDTAGDYDGLTAGVVRGRLMGSRPFDPLTASPGVPLTLDVPWVVEPGGEIYTKGEIISDDLVQGDSLEVSGGYVVACAQTDRTVNIDLRIGQSEQDAAGVPYWRFDRTNGWWECIGTNGTDAAIYFPILYTGRLMETEVQVYENTLGQFVYAALQIVTPVWGTPSSAPTFVAANEGTFAGSGGVPWGEVVVNHSLGLGTLINLSTNGYAIRVRATQIGARIRAIRQSIRYISMGPGGIGG
jgi:hypothetical protein